MRCPECGSKTRVTNSRPREDGTIFRQRECRGQGHRFGTIEVLRASVLEAERRGRDGLAKEIATALAEVLTTKDKEAAPLAQAS